VAEFTEPISILLEGSLKKDSKLMHSAQLRKGQRQEGRWLPTELPTLMPGLATQQQPDGHRLLLHITFCFIEHTHKPAPRSGNDL
jgi:hypothetical protein